MVTPPLPLWGIKSLGLLSHNIANKVFWTPDLTLCRNMASQSSIKKFFKPVSKRTNSDNENSDGVYKKAKVFDKNDSANSVSEPPTKSLGETHQKNELNLTPEQKQRMIQNKLKAEIKQQCKKTPALHVNIGHSWYCALKSHFTQPYFEKLSNFLEHERSKATIFPPEDQVFSWTQHCDLKDIKVVILGQDPYHGPKQAHGLCFSVQIGVQPPPSLLNMYRELESDIPGFVRPSHGYLLGWAKQGVLLLNACLTVQAHKANSHKDQGWETFTDAVIRTVTEYNKGVVFILWGTYAQKKASFVDKKMHHLLYGPHPSPLSARRGFFGCKHFSKCNDLLKKDGKKPIDWSDLPEDV